MQITINSDLTYMGNWILGYYLQVSGNISPGIFPFWADIEVVTPSGKKITGMAMSQPIMGFYTTNFSMGLTWEKGIYKIKAWINVLPFIPLHLGQSTTFEPTY